MKKIFAILLLFVACESIQKLSSIEKPSIDLDKLKKKSREAHKYCLDNNLNSELFILIDYSLHSGVNRFVVWDFKRDTIRDAFLVSHGCGKSPWGKDFSKTNATFSNVPDSHCSSLGKYIIGKRGYSNWGIHVNYLLHGQDESNNNALKREIILHSWEDISDEETYPKGTPEGWGCPAISNNNMKKIDKLLQNSKKQVLMWAIN